MALFAAVLTASWSLAPIATARLRDDLSVIQDAAAPIDTRIQAARRLLALPEAEARAQVQNILDAAGLDKVSHATENTAQDVLLQEIAADCSAPVWLVGPLATLAQTGPDIWRISAVNALGSIRTRESARTLLAILNETDTPQALSEAVCRSLARLSGCDSGFDRAKWGAWFTKVELLSDAEWNRQLADAFVERADAADHERDRAYARLLDDLRKRYQAASTIEDRSALLEEFIRDDLGPVRRLGLQLSLQELANARAPGPNVALAAAAVLRDPSPEFRRSAAEVLNVLAPASMAGDIHQALVFETDPAVAPSLLRCAARWPSERSRPTVIRWLEIPGPAQSPAMDAAAGLLDADLLKDPADRARVLTVLRAIDVDDLPSSGLRLLLALGGESDRTRVIALLSRPDAATRQRAADALARDPGGLDALLDAAMNDSSLFAVAARSVVQHRRTPTGFAAVAALPASSPEERRQQLLLIADRLTPGELLAIARSTADAELRERLLARLTSEPLRSRMVPEIGLDEETQHPEVIAGLLLLCQTRLDLAQPASAIKALDAIDPVKRFVEVSIRDSLRTYALLLLGRVDEASRLDGSPISWVEALEQSIDEAHAKDILLAIDHKWDDRLDPELKQRVQAARAEIEQFVGPTSDVPRP